MRLQRIVTRGKRVHRLATKVGSLDRHRRPSRASRTYRLIRVKDYDHLRRNFASRDLRKPINRAVARCGSIFRLSVLQFKLGIYGTRGVHGCPHDHCAHANSMTLCRRQVFLVTYHNRRSSIVTTFRPMRQVINTSFLRASEYFTVFRLNCRAPVLILNFRRLTTNFRVNVRTQRFLPRIVRKTFGRIVKRGRILLGVTLFRAMANLTYRGRRFTSGVLSTRISAQVKLKMAFLLHRLGNLTREGINASFVRSVIRHATRRNFGLRCLVATVSGIIGNVSSKRSNACVNFGRMLRATLTNGLFRFAMILMFKEDNGLIDDRCQGVIRRRILMGKDRTYAYHAIRGSEIGSIRASGLVARHFRETILSLLLRFFAGASRVRAFTTRRNFIYVNGTRCVRLRTILLRRLLTLTIGLLCRTTTCNSCTTSGGVRCLVFQRRREVVSSVRQFTR